MLTFAFGFFFYGMSILANDAGLNAPHWVIGGAGGNFLLAGMAILGQDLPIISAQVRALLTTVFGAVTRWVSFGAGYREPTSALSIPFLSC